MDLSKLTSGEKVVFGAGLALILDLVFFPWHDFILITRTAVQNPNSFWGTMALLLTVAMVVVVAVSRFSSSRLPAIPVPWGEAMFLAGTAVAGLLVFKVVIETTRLAFGAWAGVLLGGAMAYGGYLMRQEASPAKRRPPTDLTG